MYHKAQLQALPGKKKGYISDRPDKPFNVRPVVQNSPVLLLQSCENEYINILFLFRSSLDAEAWQESADWAWSMFGFSYAHV